jgi:hypothetical protein
MDMIVAGLAGLGVIIAFGAVIYDETVTMPQWMNMTCSNQCVSLNQTYIGFQAGRHSFFGSGTSDRCLCQDGKEINDYPLVRK